MSTTEDICFVCGNTQSWHRENNPVHKFSVEGAGQLNEKKKPGPTIQRGMPADTALRMALVNAGVISYSDIIVAEEALKNAAANGQAIFVGDKVNPGERLGVPNDGDSSEPSAGSGH